MFLGEYTNEGGQTFQARTQNYSNPQRQAGVLYFVKNTSKNKLYFNTQWPVEYSHYDEEPNTWPFFLPTDGGSLDFCELQPNKLVKISKLSPETSSEIQHYATQMENYLEDTLLTIERKRLDGPRALIFTSEEEQRLTQLFGAAILDNIKKLKEVVWSLSKQDSQDKDELVAFIMSLKATSNDPEEMGDIAAKAEELKRWFALEGNDKELIKKRQIARLISAILAAVAAAVAGFKAGAALGAMVGAGAASVPSALIGGCVGGTLGIGLGLFGGYKLGNGLVNRVSKRCATEDYSANIAAVMQKKLQQDRRTG
jgi:hypothetical protein